MEEVTSDVVMDRLNYDDDVYLDYIVELYGNDVYPIIILLEEQGKVELVLDHSRTIVKSKSRPVFYPPVVGYSTGTVYAYSSAHPLLVDGTTSVSNIRWYTSGSNCTDWAGGPHDSR